MERRLFRAQKLENNIKRGMSYIIKYEGTIRGSFVFTIVEDPTYQHIEDCRWLDENLPYGTNRLIWYLQGIFHTP